MGKSRVIYRYTLDGKFVCGYKNTSCAADAVMVDESTLRRNVDTSKSIAGFYWSRNNSKEGYPKVFRDFIKKSVFMAKRAQKYQDLNRIENKTFREYARIENALTTFNESLIEILEEKALVIDTKSCVPPNKGVVLFVQLSDTHFNELVDLPNNHYDFIIASKRLKKYADYVKRFAAMYKVKKVIVGMTGDLLNSDRRLDELLSMATNRAKASVIASYLLAYFIQDLNTIADISVAYVTGNESRMKDEYGYSDFLVSDNYDTLIFNMLKMLFKNKKGVEFIEGDPYEVVLNINGNNLLMLHGYGLKKELQGDIQKIIGKYSAKKVVIDYVVLGHIHFTNITDLYTRCGSLIGSNVYSDRALNLVTKASQVFHIFEEDKSIHNHRVDLNNTKGVIGYPIEDDLEAYNVKSEEKLYREETIVKIVI